MNFQRYYSQNYFDWGSTFPWVLRFPETPRNETISITVETSLYYITNKRWGTMLRDEDKFGGYGGLSLHYYFGKTK